MQFDFLRKLGSVAQKKGLTITKGVDISRWGYADHPVTSDRILHTFMPGSSVMLACVQVISKSFSEPPLRVYDAKKEPLEKHPALTIWQEPNPYHDERSLMQRSAAYNALLGNDYWFKLRDNSGIWNGVVPLHGAQVTPVKAPWDTDPMSWVTFYEYRSPDGQIVQIPPSDIIHFAWPMPDPNHPILALPPIFAAATSIEMRTSLNKLGKSLLDNDGMPRGLLTSEDELTKAERDELRTHWTEMYAQRGFGGLAVLSRGLKYQRLSLDLNELDFTVLARLPEIDIVNAFDIPAILVGIEAGLNRSTYSNVAEARKDFTERVLKALWTIRATTIQRHVRMEIDKNAIVEFDLSTVEVLQENMQERVDRVRNGYNDGVVTHNEYRSVLGLPDDAERDGLYKGEKTEAEKAEALAMQQMIAGSMATADAATQNGKEPQANQDSTAIDPQKTDGSDAKKKPKETVVQKGAGQ